MPALHVFADQNAEYGADALAESCTGCRGTGPADEHRFRAIERARQSHAMQTAAGGERVPVRDLDADGESSAVGGGAQISVGGTRDVERGSDASADEASGHIDVAAVLIETAPNPRREAGAG